MKHLAIVDGRDTTTAIANARLIVRAVNAFEPMREALKAIDTCWSDPADGYTKPDSKRSKSHLHPDTIKIWKQIRSALALADKDVRP